jgi:hypothetical protein
MVTVRAPGMVQPLSVLYGGRDGLLGLSYLPGHLVNLLNPASRNANHTVTITDDPISRDPGVHAGAPAEGRFSGSASSGAAVSMTPAASSSAISWSE